MERGREGESSATEAELYNYEHFRTRHFASDFVGTLQGRGVAPGQEAPDFELAVASGGTLRLSSLRGRPTLLHFGSPT